MYTSTESILTGNARRNKLVDAAAERRLNEMPGPYCRSKFQRLKACRERIARCDWVPTLLVLVQGVA